MAVLASTVYVKDPDTHDWVICDAGTEPEPRLAVLIRTPSAWEGSVLPEFDPADLPAPADEPPSATEEPGPAEPATEEPGTEEPGPAEPATEEPDKKPRTRRPTTKAAD